jgi:transposase
MYLFSEDLSATQISHLTKISRPSINKYLTAFRLRIIDYCQDQSPLNEETEVDEPYFSAPRVHHSKNEFARGNSHINGIESFWGYAKTRLVKFKGMNKNMFELHLK